MLQPRRIVLMSAIALLFLAWWGLSPFWGSWRGQAAQASLPSSAGSVSATAAGEYVLLAWNDLGMHCYNSDFQDLAVLPPYNTVWAQVIVRGDPPRIVTQGLTVEYSFPDNTYSAGKPGSPDKTNFWQYAQRLFGLAQPLPPNVGLKGKGLSGEMDPSGDHFVAEGIPLTEYSDADVANTPFQAHPYQLATIIVKDKGTGRELVRLDRSVVVPVSSEMLCSNCHSDNGPANSDIATGRVALNILTLHDRENQGEYPAGHEGPLVGRRPVLCAECHNSNALGAPGLAELPSLSGAMHDKHAEEITQNTSGCYNCHPGPVTRCLRDTMSENYGMTCVSCHGDMKNVAANPNPWLNEPRCDSAACHGSGVAQTQPLYRASTGHSGVYCEGCHDSTHAIAPSREPNDALKFIALQGTTGTLQKCSVCHASQPSGTFSHRNLSPSGLGFYLPIIQKTQ